jgi:L-lactate dehydrogenase
MKKVAIIGAGNVGAHIASYGIARNFPVEFLLVDMNQEFETAQVLDLEDTLLFSPKSHVRGVDFGDKDLTDADIFVITAGAKMVKGENRCHLMGRNIETLKAIRDSLGKIKKSAVVIVVSNPVDVLTQVAVKLFGLPKGHVFGTGTLLDSARLRWRLADRFNKNIFDVTGMVMGEHGDSEFVAWSTVKGAEEFTDLEKEEMQYAVMREAYEIIEGKGATYFGIGSATAEIIDAVLTDEGTILPVSAPLSGQYGIKNMAMGVPSKIGKGGIQKIMRIKLSPEEELKLRLSANKLKGLLKECKF